MPMEEDELSNVNKPNETELQDEKLENEGIKSAEKCESPQKLGESSLNVGGEIDGLEGNKVEGHTAAEEPEITVEAVVVAEFGESDMVVAESRDPPIDAKPEEQEREVNDGELQMDELPVGAQDESKAGEKSTHVVDDKVEGFVSDIGDELKTGARGDELPVDPQIEEVVEDNKVEGVGFDVGETKAEEVLTQVVEKKVEGVDIDVGEIKDEEVLTQVVDDKVEGFVADVGDVRQVCELHMDSELSREMGNGKKVEEVGGMDNELVDSWTAVENNTETLVEGDDVATDSEVRTAEKPAGVEDEKIDPVITEDIVTTEVKTDVEMITGVIAHTVDASEQDKVPDLSGDIADVREENVEDRVVDEESLVSDAKMVEDENTSMDDFKNYELDEHVEDRVVADEESLMPGVKMVEDENTSMDAFKNPELNEPVNAAENMEEAVKEEDIKTETLSGVELESSRNDVADEVQLGDAEVETDTGTEMVADKIAEEDSKMETEETSSDAIEEEEEDEHEEETRTQDSPDDLQDEEDEQMAAEEDIGTQDTEMETETDVADSGKTSGGKRKRGKSSKSPPTPKAAAKASSKKTVGEDVCFICFDGGELVLCDRRGCPKAYHPSCVNRDEAFFKSKGHWNCGWHLCSICEKNARYMCYTCTFSLCKSCTKDAVISCVRGNKGFCETCMRTVLLIENNEQTQVDFDDKSSWEYLFKDYYIELKSKLSLTPAKIAEAKNPWKGGPSKQESSEAHADGNDGGSGSDYSVENAESTRPKRRKVRKQSKSLTKEKGSVRRNKATSSSENPEWASKELLEFVSHMKNGDTSVVSQFDVQALLLEYIKINKLRDPRRKSQIICDTRLENLFGKPRVGHFEMLKLLESHYYLIREEQNDDAQGSVVDTETNQLDNDGNADPLTKGGKDRKRKTRKKREPQYNLDDYAAIDMHNISLIYLRRKLMEDLLEEGEEFQDKVIGTFVRIRISGSTQKQDLYRLVQVVGTSKAPEPYKVGKKTTDIMVEILNLDKTEIISMDTISNQEFTEEECKRLRQSIKCGLISRLTVGEILDKTTEIQTARVNDWLESETLRLSHLRDRASDLGQRKQLRECVEKLQLLKTPEERRRRLEEVAEIHSDPKMDPSYESDEKDSEAEDNRRDAFMRSKGSTFSRRGKGHISPGTDSSAKDSWSGSGKVSSKHWESSRSNFSTNPSTHIGENVTENSWNLERDRDTQESNNFEKLNYAATGSRAESYSGVTSLTPQPQAFLSPGVSETAVKINESEKIWHYKDPAGKVQGPFSMVQLRKWNNTGYFPADLKVWRATESPENSMLVADALAGKFPSPAVDNILHSPSLNKNSKWAVNDNNNNNFTNLPSPTPTRQSNAGFVTGANNQTPGVVNGGMLSSPTPVLPTNNTGFISPTPSSQVGPTAHMQHGYMATAVQPVQTILGQNLQSSGYSNWGSTPNVQNNSPGNNLTADVWGNQNQPANIAPNAYGSIAPAAPADNNNSSSMGGVVVGPANPNNTGWGSPNMVGWGGNMAQPQPPQNMNWAPPAGNTAAAGWVPPVGNMNSGYTPPPVQGWGPPSANSGAPSANQGWGPPPANNNNNNQFSGQRGGGGQGRDSGYNGGGGGRPWNNNNNNNRQSSFGGGGSRNFNKGDMVCPYNANGRCRKGARCDYRHT